MGISQRVAKTRKTHEIFLSHSHGIFPGFATPWGIFPWKLQSPWGGENLFTGKYRNSLNGINGAITIPLMSRHYGRLGRCSIAVRAVAVFPTAQNNVL